MGDLLLELQLEKQRRMGNPAPTPQPSPSPWHGVMNYFKGEKNAKAVVPSQVITGPAVNPTPVAPDLDPQKVQELQQYFRGL